jgi:hypothetical protein
MITIFHIYMFFAQFWSWVLYYFRLTLSHIENYFFGSQYLISVMSRSNKIKIKHCKIAEKQSKHICIGEIILSCGLPPWQFWSYLTNLQLSVWDYISVPRFLAKKPGPPGDAWQVQGVPAKSTDKQSLHRNKEKQTILSPICTSSSLWSIFSFTLLLGLIWLIWFPLMQYPRLYFPILGVKCHSHTFSDWWKAELVPPKGDILPSKAEWSLNIYRFCCGKLKQFGTGVTLLLSIARYQTIVWKWKSTVSKHSK